jgi:hypothetical protein
MSRQEIRFLGARFPDGIPLEHLAALERSREASTRLRRAGDGETWVTGCYMPTGPFQPGRIPDLVTSSINNACGLSPHRPNTYRTEPIEQFTSVETIQMQLRKSILRDLIFGKSQKSPVVKVRRARRVGLSCESLEGRVVPAHLGIAHHAVAHLHTAVEHAKAEARHEKTAETTAASTTTTASSAVTTSLVSSSDTSTTSSTSSTGSSSSSTLATALQTLRNDVLTIEQSSGTTIGELAAITASFQTLETDGLSPSTQSALKAFENTLVTDYASGTTLIDNATLLSEFEALYTSTPTTQETTDLTTAYNALAAAATSSNITAADIALIDTDWAAVLAAEGSTSTATYPYFNLVTGQGDGFGGGGGMGGGGC